MPETVIIQVSGVSDVAQGGGQIANTQTALGAVHATGLEQCIKYPVPIVIPAGIETLKLPADELVVEG
jgi:hypothetical protein